MGEPGQLMPSDDANICPRLWGNPNHLEYVNQTLRKKYSEDQLHIRIPKTNSGNYTYDGIELGGERITQEIEEYLREFSEAGVKIAKFSIVGYSMGGLVARYALGLLDSRGWFDEGKLRPINFTAFASPFLGTRNPYLGPRYRLWNTLGSTTLSVSGQQLFLTDNFRDTGRPMLAVLADPQSIFIKALAKFKHRVLYCNIINDRSVPYYTGAISLTDPFTDLEALELNHMPGRAPNLLDAAKPVQPKLTDEESIPLYSQIADAISNIIKSAPPASLIALLTPVFVVGFLVNAGIQSFRSQQRIKIHEGGNFRIPLLTNKVRSKMEEAFEDLNPRPRPQRTVTGSSIKNETNNNLLPITGSSTPASTSSSSTWPSTSTLATTNPPSTSSSVTSPRDEADYYQGTLKQISTLLPATSASTQPLALTSDQIAMVSALDEVGFRKFRVHITKVRYSHAAVIVRSLTRKSMREGEVVVGHWVDTQFEI